MTVFFGRAMDHDITLDCEPPWLRVGTFAGFYLMTTSQRVGTYGDTRGKRP